MRKWIVRTVVGILSLTPLAVVAWTSYFLGALQSHDHRAAFDGLHAITVLQALRRGDVDDAINMLELELDGQILIHRDFDPTLARWMDASGLQSQSTDCLMARIAEYRSAHPSSSSDERVRAAIGDALRRYDRKMCKRK